MQEIWKDIPSYEGKYQVSNLGRVKSKRFNKEKILKQYIINKRYFAIDLQYKNIKTKYTLHQLVAMAFLDHTPCGFKLVVDHINNNSFDNNLNNLRIITQRENIHNVNNEYSSKFKGVSFNKLSNKWMSQIYINGKSKYLGLFDSEYEAHLEYQKALDEIKKGG